VPPKLNVIPYRCRSTKCHRIDNHFPIYEEVLKTPVEDSTRLARSAQCIIHEEPDEFGSVCDIVNREQLARISFDSTLRQAKLARNCRIP
jgi:hypothetical protein